MLGGGIPCYDQHVTQSKGERLTYPLYPIGACIGVCGPPRMGDIMGGPVKFSGLVPIGPLPV
jgi:hypothetical protein